jgi:hypothetical protein
LNLLLGLAVYLAIGAAVVGLYIGAASLLTKIPGQLRGALLLLAAAGLIALAALGTPWNEGCTETRYFSMC